MTRTARLLALLLLLAAVIAPAAAFAHRTATKSQRTAILAAVVRQRQLSPAQAACQQVTVSSVNSSYAATTWPAKLSRACQKVAANGMILEHDTSRGWQFVAVGSEFRCPIKGIPTAVARDLGACSGR